MSTNKALLKQLYHAIKKLDIYQDSLISLELFLGLHPQKQNYVAKIKFWSYFLIFMEYFVCCTVTPVYDWKGFESLKDTDVVTPCYQLIFTSLAYKFRFKTLNALLIGAEQFWSLDTFDATFQTYLKRKYYEGTRYIYTFKAICFVSISRYYIKPLSGRNLEFRVIWNDLCSLENTYCYVLALVNQYYANIIIVLTVTIFDGMYVACVVNTYMQLKMIKYKMENVKFSKDSDVNKEAAKDLVTIISHHSFMLNYINSLNKFYSLILLSQVLCTTSSLCMDLFLLTQEKMTFTNLVFFMSYLLAIYVELTIFCQSGQVILDECEAIAEVIYCCNWWQGDVKVQKMILLMLTRSQKLGKLTVGGVCDTDLTVYLRVSKAAFSFYTLIKELYTQ